MPASAPTITTAELLRLVTGAEQLWLIYAPDDPGSEQGCIPGSLVTTDERLLGTLADEMPMVVYGDSTEATRAHAIAARFASQGRDTRWYAGGVQAWTEAGLPVELA